VLKPQPGDSVVVLGAGGVGLSAVMAAVILGCKPIVVEPRADRRQIATSLGAALTIDPAGGNLTQAITEGTGGGARVIVDTTGIPAVIEAAVEGLGTRGSVGLIGMQSLAARGSFAIVGLVSKGITIRGIVEGDSVPDRFLPYLMDLYLLGRFPVDALVKYYDFEQVNAAAADQAGGATIKPILRFS
jgi:aryl-alcohol dehydrogenase